MPKKPTGKPNGRPRKNIAPPKPEKKGKVKPPPSLDLSSRESLVAFANATLQQQIVDADGLVIYYKLRLEGLTKLTSVAPSDLSAVENGYRQALKHRDELWTKLSKQLDLMEDMASRGEANPLYTPVHLSIVFPPASIVVAPKFEAPPDEPGSQ